MSLQIPLYESTATAAALSTVGDMLIRVAAEIDLAAENASDLQSALSPLLAQSGSPLVSRKIQGLDLLEQTLRDLGAVLDAMASTHAAESPLDSAQVVARCKLSAVARRLSGVEADGESDDLELF